MEKTKNKTKKEVVKKKKPVKKSTVIKKTDKKKVATKKPLKPTLKKEVEETKEPEFVAIDDRQYFEATGRRKSAVARVRLFVKGKKEFIVNDKSLEDYFPLFELREDCLAALKKMKCLDKFRIEVKTKGGGINAQAEAIRHGISRALFLFNPEFKKRLRRAGYLTRDPRRRERKKPGLKRARRAPQWKKR